MWSVVIVIFCLKTFVACNDVTVKINDVDIPVRKTTEGGYSGTYNFSRGGFEKLVCRSRLHRTSVTRIYLAVTDKKPDFGVIINDQILPTVHCPYDFEFKNEGLCHDYFYYAGENIIIKSYQNDKLYGNMICKSSYGEKNYKCQNMKKKEFHVTSSKQLIFREPDPNWFWCEGNHNPCCIAALQQYNYRTKSCLLARAIQDFTPTSSVNFTEVLANTSGIIKFNATCEPASSEGAQPVHILIKFVRKLFIRARNDNVGLQMHGLSLSRVLAAYESSNSSSIALYKYHDDDVLHMKCNSYSRYNESVSLLWKYDARISVKNAGTESNSISGDFKLDASRKTGVVSCIIKRNDNSTESLPYIGIILVRRQ